MRFISTSTTVTIPTTMPIATPTTKNLYAALKKLRAILAVEMEVFGWLEQDEYIAKLICSVRKCQHAIIVHDGSDADGNLSAFMAACIIQGLGVKSINFIHATQSLALRLNDDGKGGEDNKLYKELHHICESNDKKPGCLVFTDILPMDTNNEYERFPKLTDTNIQCVMVFDEHMRSFHDKGLTASTQLGKEPYNRQLSLELFHKGYMHRGGGWARAREANGTKPLHISATGLVWNLLQAIKSYNESCCREDDPLVESFKKEVGLFCDEKDEEGRSFKYTSGLVNHTDAGYTQSTIKEPPSVKQEADEVPDIVDLSGMGAKLPVACENQTLKLKLRNALQLQAEEVRANDELMSENLYVYDLDQMTTLANDVFRKAIPTEITIYPALQDISIVLNLAIDNFKLAILTDEAKMRWDTMKEEEEGVVKAHCRDPYDTKESIVLYLDVAEFNQVLATHEIELLFELAFFPFCMAFGGDEVEIKLNEHFKDCTYFPSEGIKIFKGAQSSPPRHLLYFCFNNVNDGCSWRKKHPSGDCRIPAKLFDGNGLAPIAAGSRKVHAKASGVCEHVVEIS